jgi:hypothetical protein
MLGFLVEAIFYLLLGFSKQRLKPITVIIIATIVMA